MSKPKPGKVSWPSPTRAPKPMKAPSIFAAVGGKPKAGLAPGKVPRKASVTRRENAR